MGGFDVASAHGKMYPWWLGMLMTALTRAHATSGSKVPSEGHWTPNIGHCCLQKVLRRFLVMGVVISFLNCRGVKFVKMFQYTV